MQIFVLILGLAMLYSVASISQNVIYTYDDVGNRTSRTLEVLKITNNSESDTCNTNPKDKRKENGTKAIDNVAVTIYPNPNNGAFEVKVGHLSEETVVDIFLYTLCGEIVNKQKHASETTTIDINDHKPGTYILTVIIDGKKKTWKVVKQ